MWTCPDQSFVEIRSLVLRNYSSKKKCRHVNDLTVIPTSNFIQCSYNAQNAVPHGYVTRNS